MNLRRYLIRWDPRKLDTIQTDILVIGSGIAGLRAAIEASQYGRVLLITKNTVTESNTFYAQGGIAAQIDNTGSIAGHIKDTIEAGQGLSDPRVVESIIKRGLICVKELVEWGCRFDKHGNKYDFAWEGGHKKPRILHAGGDSTGKTIVQTLLNRVNLINEITVREYTFVVDLITQSRKCYGVIAYDLRTKELFIIQTRQTILATGGAGQLYRETTNPDTATGDGLALAYRAGCLLQGLEFVQFHPTALYVAGATRALISEAVRGAGGILRDKAGKRFMPAYHPQAELAPRDIVARAIINQMKLTNDTNVYLDLTHLPKHYLAHRFPGLYGLGKQFGIDMARDPIPVRPSAHYFIGGIKINLAGATGIKNLYAAGEVASSGFHGANRLGSNSLLESLVLGERCGRAAGKEAVKKPGRRLNIKRPAFTKLSYAQHLVRLLERSELQPTIVGSIPLKRNCQTIDIGDARNSLKSLMWREVGVEREGRRLKDALKRLDYWSGYVMNNEFEEPAGWELQNMLTLGYLVTLAAGQRTESRGAHYRTDYPKPDNKNWRNKYIILHS